MYKRMERAAEKKCRRVKNSVAPRRGSHTQGRRGRVLMSAGLPTIVILSQLASQRRALDATQVDAVRKGESP